MTQNKFSIKARMKSFQYAFEGLRVLWIEEHNARIHMLAMLFVICLGIITKIDAVEWLIVVLAIGFVFAMEAINSSVEALADYVSPEKRPLIKKVKDLSAGAVLISAITSAIIGIIIFAPKLISYV